MSQLTSLLSQRGPSDLENAQAVAIEQQRTSDQFAAQDKAFGSFDQNLRAAIDSTVPGYFARQYVGASFERDPSFQMDRKTFDELTADLPREYWPKIAQAESRAEADYLALTYQGQMESRQRLANAGWSGAALSIGASVVDPAYLAAGFLTGGLMTAGRVATIAGLARNGLVASVPFAAIAEYKASQDPAVTQLDVLKEAAGGFAFQAGLSRFANASTLGRAAAGGLGMALPTMAIDYATGESTADVLKIGASQLLFGGIFGAMSPRDVSPRAQALAADLHQAGTNMAKDAAKIQLALPPGAIRTGGATGSPTGELPPMITISGYQFFTAQMTDAERAGYAVMTGYGRLNAALEADLNANHGGVEAVGKQMRDLFQAKIDLGENPAQALKSVSAIFQTWETFRAPSPMEEPAPIPAADPAPERIGTTLVHKSYTDRVAAIMDNLLDEGGDQLARLMQFESVPQIDEAPITPRGTVPDGARLSPAAEASIAAEAPFTVPTQQGDIQIDAETLARFTDSAPLGEGLNIPDIRNVERDAWPYTVSKKYPAGTPYEKMTSEDLIAIAKATGANEKQSRSGIIRALTAADAKPSSAKRLEAWANTLESNARARMKANRGIPRGRGVGAVDVGAIADTAVIIAAKVIKLGAKAAQKLDSVVRSIIAQDHPELAGKEDEIINRVRPMLAMGVDQNTGEFSVDAFQASLKAVPAAQQQTPSVDTAATPKEQRGHTGFFPDTNDKGQSWIARNWVPKSVQRILFPFAQYLGGSSDPEIRVLARMGMTDPIPTTKNGVAQPVREGAVQWIHGRHSSIMSEFNIASDAAYAAHIAEANAAGAKPMNRNEFHIAAGRAVRRPDAPGITPSVRQAAAAWTSTVNNALQIMVDHGVPGAASVKADPTYITRMADENLVARAIAKHGRETIEDMVYNAIIDTGGSEKVRRSIAKAWLANASGYGNGDGFLSMNPETLFARVKAVNPDLTVAEVQEISKVLLPGQDRQAGTSNLKNRILMDELRTHTAPDGTKLSVEDLLVNDISHLADRYSRSSLGAAAETAIINDFSESIGRKFSSTDEIKRHFEVKWANQGYDGTISTAEKDIEYLDAMFKMIRGRQVHAFDSGHASFARSIGNMNFFQQMSNIASGVTNYMEVSSILANHGTQAFFEAYPEAQRIFLDLASGKGLDSQSAREMIALGLGTGRISRPRSNYNSEEGVSMSGIEHATAKAARIASDVSGQSFGQDSLELAAGLVMQQRLINEALTSGISLNELRMRSVGWTAEDVAAIEAQIKKHHTTDESGIRHSNLDKWEDIQAAARFAEGIRLASNRMIQRGDRSQIPLWMSHPLGKLLMQLKTFSVQATVGKLAFNARMRDKTAAVDMVVSSITAGLGYMGATYIRSIGRPNREEYLRKNLDPKRVLAASFSRAGYSGVIPSIIDTGMDLVGQPEIFSSARNTELQNNLITGSPTFQWATSAAKIPQGLIHWAQQGQLNQQDVKAIRDGLWIPNAIGVRGLIEQWSQHLPKRAPQPQPFE